MNQIARRLALLNNHQWSFGEILRVHGIDLRESQSLLAQYGFWADKYRKRMFVLDGDAGLINRVLFELFLQDRELLGIRVAAIKVAVEVSDFKEILDQCFMRKMISEQERHGDFVDTCRASLVRDIHRRFPDLRAKSPGSYQSYIRSLHRQFELLLGRAVEAKMCVTSEALEEDDVSFAHDYDCLTDDPIGLPFQLALSTPKNISLEPDCITLLTYSRNQSDLADQLLGSRIESFGGEIEFLSKL